MSRTPCVPIPIFAHPPTNLHEILEQAGCMSKPNLAIMDGLFKLIDFNETERIGEVDPFTGYTTVFSYETLSRRTGWSYRSVQFALDELETAGLIKREKVGKCYRVKIKIYDEFVDAIREDPDHPRRQVAVPMPTPQQLQAVQAEIDKISAEVSSMSAAAADNQESFKKKFTREPSPPSKDKAQDAEKRGEGGSLNKPENVKPASRPSRPSETQKSITESKTVLPDSDLDQIIDCWLGDSLEFTPDDFKQELVFEFNEAIHEFILPLARRHATDSPESACRDVMMHWIELVKDRRKPARYVSFIKTGPGKQALVDALKQVLGGIAAAQAMELDPTLAAMWQNKYGENWREKRQQEINSHAA